MPNKAYNRRSILGSIAGIGIGATGATILTSQDTRAATVQTNDLTFDNTTHTGPVDDVTLALNAAYSWESNTEIGGWTLRLSAGRSKSDLERVDFALGNPTSASGDGTTSLSGSLLDLQAFRQDLFTPPDGESETTVPVYARVRFSVEDTSGEVIAEDSVTESAEVVCRREHANVSVGVGGELSLTVK